MKELVVLSGKGGTGKTSVVASLGVLSGQAVLVDCDVDASDLHLVLEPRIVRRGDFVGGSKARIRPELCTACGKCEELCRRDAIFFDGPGNVRIPKTFRVDQLACEGCGVCFQFCAEKAIEMVPTVCGQWFVSETRCGPMVHARLHPGAENSGKLVTQLRRMAQEVAGQSHRDLIICDGPPGIGCPVIASLTGASLALLIAEPTPSGVHDFCRAAELTAQMTVPALLVLNKADLNNLMAARLEESAQQYGMTMLGRIPYDPEVIRAQMVRKSVVEFSSAPAAEAVQRIGRDILNRLQDAFSARPDGLIPLNPAR